MSKKHIKCFPVLLCVLLMCISFVACSQQTKVISSFNLDDYKTYTENFDKEINIGKTTTYDDAIKNADDIFIKTFGEETLKDEKPYNVYFDEENNCWYVRGTFKQPLFGTRKGGVAEIIFDVDGNVLALWHGK